MPYPRLSAIINNCGLHALTPEIKAEVLRFAAIKNHQNGYNAQYEQLKTAFARYYGFMNLNWKEFSDILNNYNPFDTQMILGPVLRLFMKEQLESNPETPENARLRGKSTIDYIKEFTDFNPRSHRYSSLEAEDIAKTVANPLGFNLRQEFDEGVYYDLNVDGSGQPKPRSIAVINLYHLGGDGAEAGGHYERTINPDDIHEYKNDHDTKLHEISELLLGSDEEFSIQFGLDLIKKHVMLTLSKEALGPVAFARENAEIALTIAQLSNYKRNLYFVPKNMAKSLLGDNLTQDTEDFIQGFNAFDEAQCNTELYDRYIKASLALRATMRGLSPDEKAFLDIISKPVYMPEQAQNAIDEALQIADISNTVGVVTEADVPAMIDIATEDDCAAMVDVAKVATDARLRATISLEQKLKPEFDKLLDSITNTETRQLISDFKVKTVKILVTYQLSDRTEEDKTKLKREFQTNTSVILNKINDLNNPAALNIFTKAYNFIKDFIYKTFDIIIYKTFGLAMSTSSKIDKFGSKLFKKEEDVNELIDNPTPRNKL